MSALDRLEVKQNRNAPSPTFSKSQDQTKDTFGFKWAKRDTYEHPAFKKATREWLIKRYCANDQTNLNKWLDGGRKLILDAGCGSGFTALLFFGELLKSHDYLGVDISNAVDVARQRFDEAGIPGDFLQSDLTQIPIPDGQMDIIFSEGVLHHTDSTRDSVAALSKKLKPGGMFAFYVYAKKAPVREFTDDLIRNGLQDLSNEEAWDALEPLTLLGSQLGEKDVELDIQKDIPFLGIPKGKISLQRLFYYYVCKAFYRPDIGIEEMQHVNFDWFRPSNCHRHTPDEVKEMCLNAGLVVETIDVEPSGITVIARKSSQN